MRGLHQSAMDSPHKGPVMQSFDELFVASLMNLLKVLFQTLNAQRRPLFWYHDDVIKWNHFPPYWPFGPGIHLSPVNSPHKGQWRGSLMFSLICAWTHGWVNNREAVDLKRHRAHYDVIVMCSPNKGRKQGRENRICVYACVEKRDSAAWCLRKTWKYFYNCWVKCLL